MQAAWKKTTLASWIAMPNIGINIIQYNMATKMEYSNKKLRTLLFFTSAKTEMKNHTYMPKKKKALI